MLVLGIETSCDETAAAILSGSDPSAVTVRAEVVHSQVALHAEYGGVVPELASRAHIQNLHPVVATTLAKAQCHPEQLDAIAVTAGPGLVGALLVGIAFANGLATALGKPLYAIHHLEGHLLSPLLDPENPITFPFLALLVSGGHTLLVVASAFGQYQVVGRTLDDAVGEAFDKGARLLGLGYPGGPAVAALAELGNPNAYRFPRILLDRNRFDFSFSGLKTALRTFLLQADASTLQPSFRADVAASYQEAIVATLASKAIAACRHYQIPQLVVAGGVGANRRLRETLQTQTQAAGIRLAFPPPAWCTDNGTMIAYPGLWRLLRGDPGNQAVDARCRWSLEQVMPP